MIGAVDHFMSRRTRPRLGKREAENGPDGTITCLIERRYQTEVLHNAFVRQVCAHT